MSDKGKVRQRKDRDFWFVQWYHKGKLYKISKYNGRICRNEEMANHVLSLMREDENAERFRIEKYTGESPTDVIPYLNSWLESQKPNLAPATYKDYQNSIKNHLTPWFESHPLQLRELRYDNLTQLLNGIKRGGKGKHNTMSCLHTCLSYAWKSGHIPAMPPFPEKKAYRIEEKPIEWLPEDRQVKVIEAIPEVHQPIFWWLKYHLRRPSEAMALFKEDYNKEEDFFKIRRAFSNKQLVDRTKTGKDLEIYTHPDFYKIMERMSNDFPDSPFFFVNPTGRLDGKHYQHDFLVDLWNEACKKVGEKIPMYAGLKHSSCSQYINQKGLDPTQLKAMTQHSTFESLWKYVKVEPETIRRLMTAKIINGGKFGERKEGTNNE